MFTGIIEELGTVVVLRKEGSVARLAIRAEKVRDDLHVGDSLATNGVCLTVERIEAAQLSLSMMPETLKRTTLGELCPGAQVNLERALPLHGRLGGHLVAGHVDGIGVLQGITGTGEERVLSFSMPRELARFVAPKAPSPSTASASRSSTPAAAPSPSPLSATRSPSPRWQPSAWAIAVNLEVDMLARYLNRLLTTREGDAGMTLEKLREFGVLNYDIDKCRWVTVPRLQCLMDTRVLVPYGVETAKKKDFFRCFNSVR